MSHEPLLIAPGKLGLAEFRLLLAHLAEARGAPPPSLAEARNVFAVIDTNASGEIDLPEFQSRLLAPGKGGMVL